MVRVIGRLCGFGEAGKGVCGKGSVGRGGVYGDGEGCMGMGMGSFV